jgi:hypothetical protein
MSSSRPEAVVLAPVEEKYYQDFLAVLEISDLLRRIADARGGGSVIFSEPADGRGRVGLTRDRA